MVLKENEKRYKEQKENLLLKLHHNEEVLKERQKKREKEIEKVSANNYTLHSSVLFLNAYAFIASAN